MGPILWFQVFILPLHFHIQKTAVYIQSGKQHCSGVYFYTNSANYSSTIIRDFENCQCAYFITKKWNGYGKIKISLRR
jgi:hypothetical protein